MLTDIFSSFPAGGAGAALLILRVFVGVAFLFHGYGKIVDIPAFAAEFGMPSAVAAAAAYTQFVGGLLLIVGLLTPLAGSAVAATMAVATSVLIARGERFIDPHGHSWEASSFYLVASIAVSLLGPGFISLDAQLFG
jgi:putative oxidoreductase